MGTDSHFCTACGDEFDLPRSAWHQRELRVGLFVILLMEIVVFAVVSMDRLVGA